MMQRGRAHERLRLATQRLHEQLDTRLAPSTLVNRAAYVRYLLTNRPCGPIEAGLADAGIAGILPDWTERRRHLSLEQDLSALDVPAEPEIACAIAPDIGAMLGWSYVLEGSRLGAALILRTVETSDDPAVRSATRFLAHGRGRDFWSSFKTVLARIDQDDEAIERASAAAVQAFERFSAAAGSAPTGSAL